MSSISFLQLNLNKCQLAQANLASELTLLNKPFICLLQEPHFNRTQKPSSFNLNSVQCFHGLCTKKLWPRAMIIAAKSLQLSKITSLTSRDTTTITLHNREEETIITAAYQDIKNNHVVYNIDNCLEKASNLNKPIILGIDSNAHSQLWQCETTNQRGQVFEETIATYGIYVCNTGKKDTYSSTIGKSIIDITLVSSTLVDMVSQWYVSDKSTFSDHKLITFLFSSHKQDPVQTRNYEKANWHLFTSNLEKRYDYKTPVGWSTDTIEKEVNKFNAEIKMALDLACPLKTINDKHKPNYWWTTELEVQKAKVDKHHAAWRKFSSYPNTPKANIDEAKKNYVTLKNEYAKMITSAKANAWQKVLTDNGDIYKLDKLIYRREQNNVSLLRGCSSAKDSLAALLDNYFPNSSELTEVEEEVANNNWVRNKDLSSINYINLGKVKEAFLDMEPLNAASDAGIKAIVYQKLPQRMLSRLTDIYRACIRLNHTPAQWCKADVIFLAKNGKTSYDLASSFRPISKFGIPLKGLEKLVKWEIERTALKVKPLFKDQHAYSRIKNTETAILRIIDEIEKGLLRKEYTLVVYLDLKGAFNNLNTDEALKAMATRQIDEDITNWYGSFIKKRVITASLLGVKQTRKVDRGTPQGGVLSPLIWNIVMDELLELLDDGIVIPIAFADDLTIILRGIDETILAEQAEKALNKANEKWLKRYGQEFCPTKCIAVMYTNRRKWIRRPIILKGETIPYKKEAKYLGVILDSKLKGNSHIIKKIGSAKKHLFSYLHAISKTYGPNPRLLKRAYDTIIIPTLLHGCHAFGDQAQTKNIKAKLSSLNRLACLMMAPVAPTTGTTALEVLYDIMPLHCLIEQKASEIMARICDRIPVTWDGLGKLSKNGTIRRWKTRLPKIAKNITITDMIPKELYEERNFKVVTNTKRDQFKEEDGIAVYTDGSVLNGKNVGCGIYIVIPNEVSYKVSHRLNDFSTIFQAEVTALKMAAELLTQEERSENTINFYSDSLSALQALNSLIIKSDTVKSCMNSLNNLGRVNKVTVRWVKAHINIEGNEIADSLAKQGAQAGAGTIINLLPTMNRQKACIREFYYKKWSNEFVLNKQARQTKLFFPKPNKNRSLELLNRSRKDLAMLVMCCTGHNFLRKHRFLQKQIDVSKCRLCDYEEESSLHIISHCPAFELTRIMTFSNQELDLTVVDLDQLLGFIRNTKIGRMLSTEEIQR